MGEPKLILARFVGFWEFFWFGVALLLRRELLGLFIPSGGTGKFIVFPLAVAGKRKLWRRFDRPSGALAFVDEMGEPKLVSAEFAGFWEFLVWGRLAIAGKKEALEAVGHPSGAGALEFAEE